MLDLVNDSTVAISTNACPEGLERRAGSGWSRLTSYEIGCYTVQVGVPAGERGRLVAPLPTTLQPGIYRSVHNISSGNARIGYLIHSTPFEVR